MKKTLLLAATAALILVGCNDKAKPGAGTNSTEGSVVTAPVDYLDAVGKAQKKAVGTVDTVALTQAIQLFYTDKGRFPKDLNELVTEKFIPRLPEAPYGSRIDYDAMTGTVKVVKE